MQLPQLPLNQMDSKASGITIFNFRAKPLFDRARFMAQVNLIIARIARRPRHLLLLSEAIHSLPLDVPRSKRLQIIPIQHIKGSVDRTADFDKDFYPLHDGLCDRWVRLASMMLQGMPLPPVDLVQVGKYYFVVDGHHRISVSRMLRHESVDAVITAQYEHPGESTF